MKQSTAAIAVLALLAAAAAAATVVAADPAPPAGRYTKQEDPGSYVIQQVGKFAVNMYKMAYMVPLSYVSTSQCWSAPAAGGGNDYWMVLTATNGATGAAGKYVSTVWGVPGNESTKWKLYTFNSTDNY